MKKRKLWRIFRSNTLPPEQAHRERLERQLLAAYDAQRIQPIYRRRAWVRFAPAMAVLLTLLTASVPANYPVQVGKRIAIEFPGDPPETAPKALAHAVSMGPNFSRTVSIQLRRIHGGPTVLIANVWGERLLPDTTILERLNALPEFTNTQISVAALEGKIHDNVAGLVRHRLFKASSTPEARERARQALVEELRRTEGSHATIDVQVDGDGEWEKVRVKVLKAPASPSSNP